MNKTKEEAKEDLRRMMPEGTTVYTICRGVAKSGMSAVYSLVLFTPEGVLDKERAARRAACVRLAELEAARRGLL